MRWLICGAFLMRDELTMRRARRSGKRKDVLFNASQTTSELSIVADADAIYQAQNSFLHADSA
jgi:uncharacterized membrane protein YciS (DUF1049 family)